MRPNPLIATFTAIVRFRFSLVPVKTAHITGERPAVNEESTIVLKNVRINFEKSLALFAAYSFGKAQKSVESMRILAEWKVPIAVGVATQFIENRGFAKE